MSKNKYIYNNAFVRDILPPRQYHRFAYNVREKFMTIEQAYNEATKEKTYYKHNGKIINKLLSRREYNLFQYALHKKKLRVEEAYNYAISRR
jgi:hypothetical protein